MIKKPRNQSMLETTFKPVVHILSTFSKSGLVGQVYVASLYYTPSGFNVVVPYVGTGDSIVAPVVYRVSGALWFSMRQSGLVRTVDECAQLNVSMLPKPILSDVATSAKRLKVNSSRIGEVDAGSGTVRVKCAELALVDSAGMISSITGFISRDIWWERNGIVVEVVNTVKRRRPLSNRMPVSLLAVAWSNTEQRGLEGLLSEVSPYAIYRLGLSNLVFAWTRTQHLVDVLRVVEKYATGELRDVLSDLLRKIEELGRENRVVA